MPADWNLANEHAVIINNLNLSLQEEPQKRQNNQEKKFAIVVVMK
jgi:hypothetical protein